MKVLAFSTGGAHITTMLGMLEELEHTGKVKGVNSFAGISAGAILAAFCATRPMKEAVNELKTVLVAHCNDAVKPHYSYFNVPLSALFQKSILDDSGLANILKEKLENRVLHSDLYVGLTNETKMSYELHYFPKGSTKSVTNPLSIYQAVHASASIPIVFEGEDGPNQCHYSDGGVYHQIPSFAIEKMMHKAKEAADTDFHLTIVSSSMWNYRPAFHSNRMPFLAQKTLHYLDCANFNNLPSDRELIKESIALYKQFFTVHFEMFAVPSAMLEKLHGKFTMDKLSHMKEEEVKELVRLGKLVVQSNCATYDISQDEPAETHLKY